MARAIAIDGDWILCGTVGQFCAKMFEGLMGGQIDKADIKLRFFLGNRKDEPRHRRLIRVWRDRIGGNGKGAAANNNQP